MNNKPNYSKGNRKEICYLIHNLGVLPYPSIKMLSKSEGSLNRTHKVICSMINDGLLEKKKMQASHGSQFLVFKNYEGNKSTLAQCIDKECVDYYSNTHKAKLYTTWGKSNTTGMRKINEAYIESIMYGAGCDSFINQNRSPNKYFNSKELKRWLGYKDDLNKNVLDGRKKIDFTKGYGIAITKGGNYIPYITWNSTLPLLSEGEHKLKNLSFEAVNKLDSNKRPIEGLMLMQNINKLNNYLKSDATRADHNKLLNMFNVYSSIYLLPYTQYGRMHLQLMCQDLWKERLIEAVFGELQNTSNINFSCHYYDDINKTGKLLFCIPDINMLYNFLIAAQSLADKAHFEIICFDYQKDFIKTVSNGLCTIGTISFNDYLKERGY